MNCGLVLADGYNARECDMRDLRLQWLVDAGQRAMAEYLNSRSGNMISCKTP